MDASIGATTATTSGALDIELDILGQQPLLRIYTQISLCYAIPDPSAHSSIVAALQNGLERLTQSFPWVAGQVVNQPGPESSSGIFKIKPLEKIPSLVVKDLRDDESAPTMEGLRAAGFPMSMLDEDIIAPRRTLPGGPHYDPSGPEPVFIFQLNFIKSGLIFTINGQHSCMDMTGQAAFIRLLSKACRNDPFTDEELKTGNLTRRTVIPFFEDTYQLGKEIDDWVVPPPTPSKSRAEPEPTPTGTPPTASWAYFSFDPKSLAIIKAQADKSRDTTTKFVSTDDAVTAFIWQSVTRARLHRLSPTEQSKLSRAVDARSVVGAPKDYPGLLQNMTYHAQTAQELVDEPLGLIASRLRSELEPSKLRFRTQALATYAHRSLDKSLFSFTPNVNPGSDMMLSSWAKVDALWGLDFNFGLGKPESVRRPRFTPFESLMYLMPKAPDGEISLAVSLREEDLEWLKADEEFSKYARYIG